MTNLKRVHPTADGQRQKQEKKNGAVFDAETWIAPVGL